MTRARKLVVRARVALAVALALAISIGSVVSCAAPPKADPVPSAPTSIDEAAVKHRVEMDEELVYAAHVRAQVTGWAYVLGGLMIAGGLIVAIFVSAMRASGVALFLVGVALWGFAMAAQEYGRTLALIGVVGLSVALLATLVLLGVYAWKARLWRTASEEQVAVTEQAKAAMAPEDKQLVYGAQGIAASTYSPSTKRMVESIRKKLSNEKGKRNAHAHPG